MKVFFYGEVTKEEIIAYLSNKEYSLLNNFKLRNDILSKNHFLFTLCTETKIKIKIKKIQPRKVLTEKNVFLREEQKFNIKNKENEIKQPEKFNIPERKNIEEEIIDIKNNYKQILKMNTKKNSGYRNVRIFYKKNVKNIPKKIENLQSKVKFCDFIENIPHNNEEIKPILVCKTNKVIEKKTPKKKKNIFILNHPEDEISFEYEIR